MSIDYHGRVFRRTEGDTVARARYHQDGNLVWVEVTGGEVRHGSLVGTCAPDGTLDLRYTLVLAGGRLVCGRTVNTPELLHDGRLRLHECWERHGEPAATGISYIEECRRDEHVPA